MLSSASAFALRVEVDDVRERNSDLLTRCGTRQRAPRGTLVPSLQRSPPLSLEHAGGRMLGKVSEKGEEEEGEEEEDAINTVCKIGGLFFFDATINWEIKPYCIAFRVPIRGFM